MRACVRVRVRACVRAWERVCVCGYARACVSMQYPAVHFCVCNISTCIIYVCSDHSFGHVLLLTTSVYLLKLLYVNSSLVWPETFLFCPLCVSASFCTAHCALNFARDHAP